MTAFKHVAGILYSFQYIIILVRSFGIYIDIWKVFEYLITIEYALRFCFDKNTFLIKRVQSIVINICITIWTDINTRVFLTKYIVFFIFLEPAVTIPFSPLSNIPLPCIEQHTPSSILTPDRLLFFKQLSCIVISLGCTKDIACLELWLIWLRFLQYHHTVVHFLQLVDTVFSVYSLW